MPAIQSPDEASTFWTVNVSGVRRSPLSSSSMLSPSAPVYSMAARGMAAATVVALIVALAPPLPEAAAILIALPSTNTESYVEYS